MPRHKDRPIMTCEELLAARSRAWRPTRAFLESAEFLKVVEALSGHPITRRTLQLYSSPHVRLLPLPRHFNGYKSHYKHPEHTERIAVILRLRIKHFIPVKRLKEIMARLSPNLYALILRDAISPEDIALLARPEGQKFHPYDLVFRRVLSLLSAVEAQEQSASPTPAEELDTTSAVERFEDWFETTLTTHYHREPMPELAWAN